MTTGKFISRAKARAAFAVAGTALLSACVTTEMIEQDVTMRMCDGYGLVDASADGISSLVIAPYMDTSRVRETPPFKAGGLKACDEALATVDSKYPQHWMRKVSLLQARALHNLVAGSPKPALADLDAADAAAAGHQDAYYERSLALNTQFIRALATSRDGRETEGDALALKALSARPYSKLTSLAALTALSPDSSAETVDDMLALASRVNPRLSALRYRHFFESGRYEQALAAFDGLAPPEVHHKQTTDLRTRLYQQESKRTEDAEFWAEMDGRKAFALAALRREGEAMAALGEGQKRLAAAKIAGAPLSEKTSTEDRTRATVREQVNRETDIKAAPVLAFWTAMTKARLAANAGDAKGAAELLKGVKLASPTLAYFDLAYRDDGTPYTGDLKNTLAMRLLAVGLPPSSPQLLFSFLMDGETKQRIAASVDSFWGLFAAKDVRERGDCNEAARTDGLEQFCFKGSNASLAIAEEQALLRVADKGAERGASAFIIHERSDIQHSLVQTYYGTPLNEFDQGFETRLTVRFLKEGEADTACWRCISIASVQQALAPFYRPPAKASEGARK